MEHVKALDSKPVHRIAERVVDGPFGTQLKVDEYQTEGIPVIRVSNVRTGEISEDKLIYITPEKQFQLRRSKVLPNDVVLTKAGAILGYSAVFPEHLVEGNITSHSAAITCGDEILPHYLKLVFHSEIGQRQIYRWGNKSTRPELNTQEVKRILIPVPSKERQQLLIDSYHSAIQKREEKENQAQELLASIDDYLLNELGINPPPEPENTIENRKFRTSYTKVFGDRLDPYYYSDYFNQLEEALADSNYPVQSLRQLLSFLESGSRPSGGVSHFEDGILSLGGEHVTNTSEINIDKPKYIPELHHLKIKRTETKMHDILLVKDGATTGKIGIIENEQHVGQNINEHVYIMRFDTIDHHYFTLLFNTKLYQKIVKKHITGATVTGLTKTAVRDISIPVPPEEVQLELVNHASQIRQSAFELRNEAIREFEQAKREIEQLILTTE